MATLDPHRDDLARLGKRDRLRTLRPRSGIDFSSNDYLGLADSPRLRAAVADALARGVPIGSGGSRLLRGNCAEHEALEAEAAAFFGTESALFLASGFTANTVLFATLPQTGDLVIYDALIHASAHEGMRLGRATCVSAAAPCPTRSALVRAASRSTNSANIERCTNSRVPAMQDWPVELKTPNRMPAIA